MAAEAGLRASQEGFLSSSLADYLQLLDRTGRQLHLAPILSRIGLESDGWCDSVRKFVRTF